MPFHDDTIAAVATPLGEGGIAVIRISGPEAFEKLSLCIDRGRDPRTVPSHTIHLATLKDHNGAPLDEVLYSVFRSPNSYTGEDVAEVSCHGGLLVTRRILESILSVGVRHAAPGEFTKRAFLSGKLDLAQAEAVAELIQASSDRAQRTSLSHLRGGFSGQLETIRSALTESLGLLELELDFAEDGYEFVDRGKVETLIKDALSRVRDLTASYTTGKMIREGVHTVLVGAPNAGKSSLMNRLLRESRAIVTEIPGTTRDVLSENIAIEGVLFRLTDTAGMRPSLDPVEKEGVRRSKEKLTDADIIVLVLDPTRPFEDQLDDLGEETVRALAAAQQRVLISINKADLRVAHQALPDRLQSFERTAPISALTGEGIPELERSLVTHVPGLEGASSPEGEIVTTARHFEVFQRVRGSLDLALGSLEQGETGEFIALDLRAALDGLGEIVGQVTSEEVLNSIFSRFCIGK